MYEEFIRGTVQELDEKYKDRVWKGEFVIILNSEG
jgi:16S rRNA C1402 (ribose-2'-O) methylase RsmI